MAIERCYSLREAAQMMGTTGKHLAVLLRVQLGLVLPEVPRGSRQRIRESILDHLLDKLGPKTDWTQLRPARRRAPVRDFTQ